MYFRLFLYIKLCISENDVIIFFYISSRILRFSIIFISTTFCIQMLDKALNMVYIGYTKRKR